MNELKNHYLIQIAQDGVWKEFDAVTSPFYTKKTLDLSLDTGKIILPMSKDLGAIKPFTPIRIVYTNNETGYQRVEYYITYNSHNEQKRFYPPFIGKNTIDLAEPTKLLEGKVCDNLTFSNPIIKDYSSLKERNAPHASTGLAVEGRDFTIVENYVMKGLYDVGETITINSPQNVIASKVGRLDLSGCDPTVTITDGNGQKTVLKFYDGAGINYKDLPNAQQFTANVQGGYQLEYEVRAKINMSDTGVQIKAVFYVTIYPINQVPKPYTIKTAFERLLAVWDSPEAGSVPKYKLASGLEFLDNIPSPEFSLTRGTLFENLLTISGHINAIPRLTVDPSTIAPFEDNVPVTEKFDTIALDFLSGDKEYVNPSKQITQHSQSYAGDDSFGAVDGFVQNMSFSKDDGTGSVRDPYDNGWKTPRSETLFIDEDTGLLKAAMPLERMTDAEYLVSYESGETRAISAFAFEAAAYATLSDYDKGILFSKNYAIRWTQGSNIIDGLTFTANSLLPFGKDRAIINILDVLGVKPSAGTPISSLAFRITYVPYVTARVTQRKPQYTDNPMTKIYNQAANNVESEYLGENMRGVVARLGNEIWQETYRYELGEEPQVGDVINGNYVAAIESEYLGECVRSTLTMTPNFNMLSQYLALDSNYRLYDVSEKQSVKRNITIDSSCFIAPDFAANVTLPVQESADHFAAIAETLLNPQSMKITGVVSVPKVGDDTIGKYMLPVASYALGNSIAFTFEFVDNYSAGDQSVEMNDAGVLKRVNQPVPYSDVFGNIDTLAINYFHRKNDLDRELAYSLPEFKGNDPEYLLSDNVQLKKDSREHIGITKQVHFQSLGEGVVLGTQLAQRNALVNDFSNTNPPKFYWLKQPLNQFRYSVDLTGAQEDTMPTNTAPTGASYVQIEKLVPSGEWTGWAIVNPDNNRLYVGVNKELKVGDTAVLSFFQ